MDRFRILTVLATVVSTGGLIGSGAGPLIAHQLLSPAPSVTSFLDPESRSLVPETHDVLAGGLFLPTEPTGDPLPPGGGETPAACTADLRLVGAAYDRRDASRSVVAIRSSNGGVALHETETFDGWTVSAITPNRVRLVHSANSEPCLLSMFSDTAIEEAPSLAPTPIATTVTPAESGAASSGVQRVTDTHFRVDPAAIEAMTARSTIRVIPYLRDGQPSGVRLFGVRPTSAAHHGGLRNGDVVDAVDGVPLTDPSVALEAYGRLMSGEALRVSVQRRGQPLELTYEVQ